MFSRQAVTIKETRAADGIGVTRAAEPVDAVPGSQAVGIERFGGTRLALALSTSLLGRHLRLRPRRAFPLRSAGLPVATSSWTG